HLVEQRLEGVEVVLVDQQHGDGSAGEPPGGGKAAETGSDDGDSGTGFHPQSISGDSPLPSRIQREQTDSTSSGRSATTALTASAVNRSISAGSIPAPRIA